MRNGIVIINKDEGISSQGVVNRVKRIFGEKKAGHTGTLDPIATGVLPVLLGRAVKASEYMLTSDKHYIATLLLGIETDTEDITGNIIKTSTFIPGESAVNEAILSMLGDSMQTPPMYSALKVNGKKLYELAREGKVIEREARRITIHSIKSQKLNEREYKIEVECTKGTYIRTLCADIGKKLGCGAVMKTLTRASASGFTLSDSYTLAELEGMSEEELEKVILPTEAVFRNEKHLTLPPFFARLASSGLEIYLSKVNFSAKLGERVLLYNENGFFALGEVREFEAGLAIKPIKQFNIFEG